MQTAVVILNWNGKDFLQKYLPVVKSSLKDYDASVIVADNGSSDGSPEYLRESHPDVETICFDRNFGFAEGYDRAFEIIQSRYPCKYFLLLNSDVEVTDNWLYPLEEWMDLHPECAVCGPKLHSIISRDEFEYAGAAGGLLDRFCYPYCRGRILDRTEKDNGQYDNPEDVLWVSGACMMVRSSVWKELGGLCADFFAHMEEIDLCWRCRLNGWRVCVVPRSMVYHLGGGSLPQDSPQKLYLNYRNNLLMMARNLPYHDALQCLYEVMAAVSSGNEVSVDDVTNCLAVFHDEMSRHTQSVIISESSGAGIKDSSRTIRKRIFWDNVTRLSYLLKGKKEYAKAVTRAHKDFRMMWEKPDRDMVSKYLVNDMTLKGKFARTSLEFIPEEGILSKVRKKCISEDFVILENYLLRNDI